jgi:SAM-dependent methyltransferase
VSCALAARGDRADTPPWFCRDEPARFTGSRRDDPSARAIAPRRDDDAALRDEPSAFVARFACAVLFRATTIALARFACEVLFGASGTERFLPFAEVGLGSARSLRTARRGVFSTRAEEPVRFAMLGNVSRHSRAPALPHTAGHVQKHAIFASYRHRSQWQDAGRTTPMSWLMSKLYDRVMRNAEQACLIAWRADLLHGLSGEILEIGAGTGANLGHYPPAVTRLVLSEPDPDMRSKLEARLRQHAAPTTEIIDASSDALPFPDASFDTTLVLCSVPDPAHTLAELRRVLRPGGTLVYLEHVAADERPDRLAWQHRIEPVWKHLAGNCHLTRRTGDTIRRAGFRVEREIRESMQKAFFFTRPTVRGIARKPA